jgi:hypothetical protein
MNEEYLWDRSGERDPEIARLEAVMGSLKYSGSRRFAAPVSRKVRGQHRRWWLAAAAVLLVGMLSVPFLKRGALTNWQTADGRRLRAGQMIDTGAAATTIEENATGELTIDSGSRVRLVQANNNAQQFHLEQGTIHALIWAPPGRFVVDTPSSRTVDLGCRYTLQMGKDGTGLVTVETGWVAFERDKLESFIPAGAACVTRPRKGPGTPYFLDAPAALTTALARFDTSGETAALDTAIAAARQRDALTLWHLMVRTQGKERGRIFDRLVSLIDMPPAATREAVIQGEQNAIDAVWNSLQLGSTDWWREWKRRL